MTSKFHSSSRWTTFMRKARPVIERTLPAPCVNAGVGEKCSGVVHPGEPFDVAHKTSHHLDPFQPLTLEAVGPSHRRCNRRAGGREGKAKQMRARNGVDTRLPQPGSGWR